MRAKIFDLWIYNTTRDVKLIANHVTLEEAKKFREELEHANAWLCIQYNEKYKFFIITNSKEQYTISEKIKDKLGITGKIKKVKPLPNEFKDAVNNEINLGDNVVIISKNYILHLSKCKVIGFTKHRVRISWNKKDLYGKDIISAVRPTSLICTK